VKEVWPSFVDFYHGKPTFQKRCYPNCNFNHHHIFLNLSFLQLEEWVLNHYTINSTIELIFFIIILIILIKTSSKEDFFFNKRNTFLLENSILGDIPKTYVLLSISLMLPCPLPLYIYKYIYIYRSPPLSLQRSIAQYLGSFDTKLYYYYVQKFWNFQYIFFLFSFFHLNKIK